MTEPTVSILIGLYNCADSLERCFDSVAAQSYPHWQIVAINDASTDQTPAVLKRYQKKFGAKLRIITNQKNLGLTKSLNRGLATIKTPYTARIDGDDWWHRDKLKHQVAFMIAHPDYGVIGCNYVNVGTKGKTAVITNETDATIRKNFLKRNQLAHSCVMFRTALVKKLGGYDPTIRYSQDYDLWLRCLPVTKFYNVPKILCYRHVGSGISVDKQRAQMRYGIQIQTKYIRLNKLPWYNYFYTLELWALVLMPEPIKQLKRRLLG